MINVRSAGRVLAVVVRKVSRYDRNEAGTRMRVPATVTPGLERVLDNIDVRISSDVHLEVPREPRARELPAHQVEQTRRKVARRCQRYGDNPARGCCAGRGDADDKRQCNEKWQNWYFFELS